MYYRCVCGSETFRVKYLRLICDKCGREYIADARMTSDTFNRYKTALNELLWTEDKKEEVA